MENLKLNLFNNKGEQSSTLDLSNEIFGKPFNSELIGQYVRVYLTNQRSGNASTLTRGEVSGSGKKPYRQKGTGRARMGSTRTPLKVKGGITFGPKPREFRLEMPKKMRVGALLSILSTRFSENNILGLNFVPTEIKTKTFQDIFDSLNLIGNKVLIITKAKDENILKSARNIEKVTVKNVNNLNAYDIISHKKIVFFEDAVRELEGKYENK